MPDDKPTSVAQVAALVYTDLKNAGSKLYSPFKREIEFMRTMDAFHPEFFRHGVEVTNFVDFGSWHENPRDFFQKGNGQMWSATLSEETSIWNRPDRFIDYEAKLVRYAQAGGDQAHFCLQGQHVRRRQTGAGVLRCRKKTC